MRIKILIALLSALVITISFAASVKTPLTSEQDKLSYTMGVYIGQSLHQQKVTINANAFQRGFLDGLQGKNPLLTKKEMTQVLERFHQNLLVKAQQQFSKEAQSNAKAGATFLAQNKNQPGVVTLKSGLQYRIIKAGNGPKPTAEDIVTVNYQGKLIDGTVFDSSQRHEQPLSFPVNQVIKAWQEALPLMRQGAIWELYVPANLAYGAHGAGNMIGPNATLIFDIHLLSIQKPAQDS